MITHRLYLHCAGVRFSVSDQNMSFNYSSCTCSQLIILLAHFKGREPSLVVSGGEELPLFSNGSWLAGVDICYATTKIK
jgi:hypothetical protein